MGHQSSKELLWTTCPASSVLFGFALSGSFSPVFQIHHQHAAKVSKCRFELHEGAIRSGCKLNFLAETHSSPCHRRCGSADGETADVLSKCRNLFIFNSK